MAFGLQASKTINDDLLGLFRVAPALDVDELAGLEVFVAREEVVQLVASLLGNIR